MQCAVKVFAGLVVKATQKDETAIVRWLLLILARFQLDSSGHQNNASWRCLRQKRTQKTQEGACSVPNDMITPGLPPTITAILTIDFVMTKSVSSSFGFRSGSSVSMNIVSYPFVGRLLIRCWALKLALKRG